jgi:hypothetical protein
MNTFIQFNKRKYTIYDYGVLTILTDEKTDEFDDYTNVSSILFPGIQDVKITLENGELFNKELNQWTTYIELNESIMSEKRFVVRAFDKKLIDGKITGIYNNIEVEDYIDTLPELIHIETGEIQPVRVNKMELSEYISTQLK